MSVEPFSPSYGVRQVTIVPHQRLTTDDGLTRSTTRCPRCHDLMVLPDWASDGDLTECCGLLLRVSQDEQAFRLEAL